METGNQSTLPGCVQTSYEFVYVGRTGKWEVRKTVTSTVAECDSYDDASDILNRLWNDPLASDEIVRDATTT